jgi:hypothetical protein
MNETYMVHSDINDECHLSTNQIQLQLEPVVNDGQHLTNENPLLKLAILPNSQDDIVVNKVFFFAFNLISYVF